MPAPVNLLALPLMVVGAFAASLCAALAWPRPARALAGDSVWTPTRPVRQPDPFSADARLELKAEQWIAKDSVVADLEIGVTAHDCVITVWGPVATAEQARHAEQRLRQLEGVAEVVNDIHVRTPEEARLLADPPVQAAVPPAPAPPLALTPPPVIVAQHAPVESGWSSALMNSPIPPPPAAPETRNETALKPSVQLLAPQPIANVAAALPALVDRVLRGSERFSAVRAQISGGVVRLHGTVRDAGDVFTLARLVSQVPGVERVVLDGLTAPDSALDK